MNQAGHYNYSNAATLFTLSDIGLSAHRYHNRPDIFTQSLENGAAQSGVTITLLNDKGQTLAEANSDADGHAKLETDKEAALIPPVKMARPRFLISNFRRWIWRSLISPVTRVTANSSLCLARAISIVRVKR